MADMILLHVSPEGRKYIQQKEGLRLHSYRDIAGVWTIGYGHTGPEVGPNTVWTKEQADEAFARRLAHEFEPGVYMGIGSSATTQGQFDALVSLAYNIGVNAFHHSTVCREHIAGNYQAAADAFQLFDRSGGVEVDALLQRRQEEAQIYLDASPDDDI